MNHNKLQGCTEPFKIKQETLEVNLSDSHEFLGDKLHQIWKIIQNETEITGNSEPKYKKKQQEELSGGS